jgi:hypothetical protein
MQTKQPDTRQLCAIARAVLDDDPSVDDAEWKERVKCRLVAQGWAYPPPHALTAALDRVERATGRCRQPSLPIASPPPPGETGRELSADEARAALSLLLRRFGPLPALKPRAVPDVSVDAVRAELPYSEWAEPLDEGRYLSMVAADDAKWRRAEWLRQRKAECDEQRAADRDVQRDGETRAEGLDAHRAGEGAGDDHQR